MKAFEHVEPASLSGVSRRLAESPSALPIAGGMDLIGLMKNRIATPDRLVSLRGVEGLATVAATDTGGVRVGSMATLASLGENAMLREHYPALVAAAESVGTPQIRNRGTLGGNLCQRPRCWYFRSELYNCLKKGGDACFAQAGDNRYHAIFANAPCAIVHPSSCAPALLAYGATALIAGPDGERELSLEEFFVLPEFNVRSENILAEHEVLVGVELPAPPSRSASYVVKFKQSHDWPMALASVALQMDGDAVASARVFMGAVAPVPWRARAAESTLAGQPIDEVTAAAAGAAAVEDADPMGHNAYKVHIAATAVKRALLAAASA